MAIEFTYEITAIDETEKKMFVTYRSEGRPTVESAARIPWENETLEQVIRHFAPITYWEALDMPITSEPITVGTTGTLSTETTPQINQIP